MEETTTGWLAAHKLRGQSSLGVVRCSYPWRQTSAGAGGEGLADDRERRVGRAPVTAHRLSSRGSRACGHHPEICVAPIEQGGARVQWLKRWPRQSTPSGSRVTTSAWA